MLAGDGVGEGGAVPVIVSNVSGVQGGVAPTSLSLSGHDIAIQWGKFAGTEAFLTTSSGTSYNVSGNSSGSTHANGPTGLSVAGGAADLTVRDAASASLSVLGPGRATAARTDFEGRTGLLRGSLDDVESISHGRVDTITIQVQIKDGWLAGTGLVPADTSPVAQREGGAVSVAQSLRPRLADLSPPADRSALGRSTGLVSGRSTHSMIMGEMARGVVIEQVAAVGARADGISIARADARLPAAGSVAAVPEESSTVRGSADGSGLPRQTAAAVVFAGLRGGNGPTVGLHPSSRPRSGSSVTAEDRAGAAEWIDGLRRADMDDVAAIVPPDVEGTTWRRLLVVAPAVILVAVQKIVDDALTNRASEPDDATIGPVGLRRSGGTPRPARSRATRRRTHPRPA